jgi:peptidoglycan/LPS O-acetylase OafA/YrhL
MQAHDRQRALDGLRGVAILMVVAYHAAPGVVRGGFVGVSVFFTLSGYLIGTRLIDEWSDTGRLDLVRFWSKRARRLLPAALVTIVVSAVVAYRRGDFDRTLGRAGLAAATYHQNWYQLSRSGGYGALFDRASPLDHFWSLAIEEQFYLMWPMIVGLIASRTAYWLAIGIEAAVVLP